MACTMTLNKKDETRLSGYASESRSERKFSNDDMIYALRCAANGHQGSTLSRNAYQTFYEKHRERPHPYTIIRRFGRWSAALEAANLPYKKRATYRGQITQEDCIQALLEARDILGHLPSVGEYEDLWKARLSTWGQPLPAWPSASTIRLKFDKWRAACVAASERIE